MSEFKTRARKTLYWLQHNLFIFDRMIIIAAVTVCLFFVWGAVSSMSRNWTLAQELANRKREKVLLELEVETLELENEYYVSAEYQELAARKYQNKKLPGETLIYLPPNSEAAKNKYSAEGSSDAETLDEPMSNFEQWLVFLFGAGTLD